MDHMGIDVHKRESQIYLLAEGGEVVEQRIRTEPERFAAVLGGRPRARILIEASTDSEWVARCLEALGREVIVADPNFAPMYATRARKVKTDRRDARALAEACLLGAYRPAHRLSDPQRHVRGRLGVRDALVHTRTRYISVIRALLRQHGYRVPSGSAGSFLDRVRRLPLPGRLRSVVAPLLAVMGPLNQQLAYSDATIEHLAVQDPRVPRLRSVPGVGPVTADAFLAAIDDIGRFHLDGWVSANVAVAAAARPLDRWRHHPSNPLMRRRVPLPLMSANARLTEPRETGVHSTPRLNSDDVNQPKEQHDRPLDTASRFIQAYINALRRRSPHPWARSPWHKGPDSDAGWPKSRRHSGEPERGIHSASSSAERSSLRPEFRAPAPTDSPRKNPAL